MTTVVVVGRGPNGKVLSDFKSAKGRVVRVLDRGAFRKACEAASKTIRAETQKPPRRP